MRYKHSTESFHIFVGGDGEEHILIYHVKGDGLILSIDGMEVRVIRLL